VTVKIQNTSAKILIRICWG